jgi:hypothetical protein
MATRRHFMCISSKYNTYRMCKLEISSSQTWNYVRNFLFYSIVFWDVTPCTVVLVHRHFEWTYCLHHQGPRVSQTRHHQETDCRHSWFLAWLIARSTETWVDFYWTSWHYIPEDLFTHRCENVTSLLLYFLSVLVKIFSVINQCQQLWNVTVAKFQCKDIMGALFAVFWRCSTPLI